MSDPRINPQRLKGFRDLMPEAMFARRHVMETLRSIFELYGFAPLETPTLEYAATLEGKYGEDERLMYKFEDLGKRKVGMRFDLTVPLARVVAMHMNELTVPLEALPDEPGVARREPPVRAIPRVLPVRRGHRGQRLACWPTPRYWRCSARP